MEGRAVATVVPIRARNALAHLLVEALRDGRERAVVEAAVEIARRPAGDRLAADWRRSRAGGCACRALLAAGLLRGDDPGAVSALDRIDPAWAEVARDRLERYAAVLARTRSGAGLASALEQARELFAAELDFEVHEILEAPWQSAVGRDRAALQGLVQAAVAWAHWQAGNRAGALSLARAAAEKLLADGRGMWHGLAVDEVARAAARWADWLARGAKGAPPPRPFAGRADERGA